MAVGTLSSPGVGSNIDISGIVSKLMQLERIPLDRLNEKKTSYQAKISALGNIKSSMSSLQSAMSGLKSGSSFDVFKVASSDSTLVTATAGTGAVAGTHSIEVSQLAQAQKLAATGQADSTAIIGAGTLSIDFGTISGGTFDSGTGTYSGATFTSNGSGPFSVLIDNDHRSLEGIRDAINLADIGVQASIVNDGDATNPYRLVLSSESGADQSIKISVSGDAALSTLLSHDPSATQNLSETVTAQNAIFNVDGISITKSSNTVTDAIAGINLNLAGETAGSPVTLNVTQDTASIKSSIEAFVKAYNDLYKQIQTQTESGINGGKEGALASDYATRQMFYSIRSEFSQSVTGLTGAYDSLSSIGVSFQRDGTLKVDSAQLASALADDSTNVAELFSSTDGYGTRVDSVLSDFLSTAGVIASRTESLEDRIDSIEDQQATLEGRLARTESYLRKQFGALDVMLGSMTVTSNYLAQQLAGLNANY